VIRRHVRILLGIVIVAIIILATLLLWPRPVSAPHQAPPIPEPAAVATPSPPTAEPDLILDLFEPTPASLDAQQQATILRNQIEHALVVTFLLTRCTYVSQQEYSDTYNAIIQYAARSGLSPDIASAAAEVHRLSSSAGASYSLVYSRVPCTDPSLPPSLASLRQWRDQSARTVKPSSTIP